MKQHKLALGALLIFMALPALAAPVTYVFGDHPDAALFSNHDPYGVRVDSAPGAPTFSVGTNLSGLGGPVTLTWDPADLAAGASISGTVERNGDGTFWTTTYTLSGLAAAGSGGFTATGGIGSLDEIGGALRSIAMSGEANTAGFVFEFDNDGWRLPTSDGWVGRGWLLPEGSTDDWLVTATIVPVPAAVWLFGSALGLLGWMRRRAT